MRARYLVYGFGVLLAGFLAFLLGLKQDPNSSIPSYYFEQPSGIARFFYDLAQQLVSAILLSAMIFEIIERSYNSRIQKIEEETFRKTLAEGIRSAFSTFYDTGLVEKVTGSIFSSPLVRNDFKVNYKLFKLEGFSDFCTFEMNYSYQVRNAGRSKISHDIYTTLSSKFSHFDHIPDKPAPKIVSASIGQKKLSEVELNRINSLIDVNKPQTTLKIGKVTLRPGEAIAISAKIITYKMTSDSETFRSTVPSLGIEVTLKNDLGKNISAAISEIGDFRFPELSPEVDDENRLRTASTEPMLPHYGWVLFWNDVDHFRQH